MNKFTWSAEAGKQFDFTGLRETKGRLAEAERLLGIWAEWAEEHDGFGPLLNETRAFLSDGAAMTNLPVAASKSDVGHQRSATEPTREDNGINEMGKE